MKTNFQEHPEAKEYKGHSYTQGNAIIIERTAKITPKKKGQFVTCWKRNLKGITEPYKDTDSFDYLIINVNYHKNKGSFKFPKEALIKHGIITSPKKDGKRGFRVYPSWDTPITKQALLTQKWQLHYFSKTTIEIYESN